MFYLLPSALAMAQEIEANHEKHAFATQYARSIEETCLTGPKSSITKDNRTDV